jgi:hypothetical protein
MDNITSEQLAAQAIAVITASFERPSGEEVQTILDKAKKQAASLMPSHPRDDEPKS